MPSIRGVTFSLSQHILKGWPNRIPYLLLSPFTTIIFYSRNTPIPDCSLKIHQLSFTTCNTSFTSIHFKAKRLLIDRSNHSFPSKKDNPFIISRNDEYTSILRANDLCNRN